MSQNSSPKPANKKPMFFVLGILGAIVGIAIFGSAAGRFVAYLICALFIGAVGYVTYNSTKDAKYWLGIPFALTFFGFVFGAFEDAARYGAKIGGSFQGIAWLLLCPIIAIAVAIGSRLYSKKKPDIDAGINDTLRNVDTALDNAADELGKLLKLKK